MPSRQEILATRYQALLERIQAAVSNSHTIENSTEACKRPVELLAVSKTYPASDIEIMYQLGQRRFGENYLQEAVGKIASLQQYPDIEWHFIGHLQSNKSRLVAEHFGWLHTLDSLKLASRLSRQRPKGLPPLNVLIQINIDQESTKSGITADKLVPLANAITTLEGIRLRGLMAIPAPQSESPTKNSEASSLAKMAQLFRQLQSDLNDQQIDTLSMGMSNDLEDAVQNSSTLLRIGTDIFGTRSP